MKKITLIGLILFFSIGISSAQFISFGIKGGLNYSNLRFDDIRDIAANSSEYHLQDDESFQGFHLGVMSRIKVLAAYIQPELYFNTAGGKVIIEEVQTGGANSEYARQIKYSKVDLPVLLGFKVGPLRVNGGPVASVILSEDNTVKDIIPELETMSKSATIGFQIGAGIDVLKFLTLDYRFEGGLSKYGDGIKVRDNTYPFDSRANVHLISLGVMF
ncbi:MAG: porin family protein [Bacteroidota bacterium]